MEEKGCPTCVVMGESLERFTTYVKETVKDMLETSLTPVVWPEEHKKPSSLTVTLNAPIQGDITICGKLLGEPIEELRKEVIDVIERNRGTEFCQTFNGSRRDYSIVSYSVPEVILPLEIRLEGEVERFLKIEIRNAQYSELDIN